MKVTIARWCRQFADWLCPTPTPDSVTLTVPKDGLFARVVELTREADGRLSEHHGEAKRHQVLAQLSKEFSGVSHRVFALAIEAALTEIR